ncbi:putative F-box/LRR-repeat protein At4g15060 [Capsella rubella]|uniref:putative F-box/LRR-repeat protein At4g15060 n=1 Tax=Capsella rubella TaxID=81985 RepID=UPI000CD5100D|nr:putative F-box/LRR-repeat protein At4g15060 [Capsella rubella]
MLREEMDRISQFPDELLLKVLMFLPTRTAVSTSVLSKRWEFIWMWLPKLEYEYTDHSHWLRDFVNLNMPLHRAPVIETFRLNLKNRSVKSKDIRLWIVIAVSRSIRELSINLSFYCRATKLPSSVYICKSLVVLKLIDYILVDVPRLANLPSLKTLLLRRVTYFDENSIQRLVSSCPVLEDLVIERVREDFNWPDYEDFITWNLCIPSLQRLALKIATYVDFNELVINTPSLKYFKLCTHYDWGGGDVASYSYDFKDMPMLEEADIESRYLDTNNFIRSITSVKRLSLCVRSVNADEALNCEGIVFNQLENLKLCLCDTNWSKLLVPLLEKSPNLQRLEIDLNDDHKDSCVDHQLVSLENQLSYVPECLRSSLKTFKWKGRHGSQTEIDVVKYILRNARCLETAAILFHQSTPETEDKRKMMMIQELLPSSRSSTTCQLVFD